MTLRIKTVLGPSFIHGTGLFAAEPIERGALVWQFDQDVGRLITREMMIAVRGLTAAFICKYGYQLTDGSWVLPVDDARFMNHSVTPNLADVNQWMDVAAHDIQVGEELTCNYFSFCSFVAKTGIL